MDLHIKHEHDNIKQSFTSDINYYFSCYIDRPAFVTFITAGYPDPKTSVDILLSLQRGGADVIELGKEKKTFICFGI